MPGKVFPCVFALYSTLNFLLCCEMAITCQNTAIAAPLARPILPNYTGPDSSGLVPPPFPKAPRKRAFSLPLDGRASLINGN